MDDQLERIEAVLDRIDQRLAAIAANVCKPEVTITVTQTGQDLGVITRHVAKEFNGALERAVSIGAFN